MPFHLAYFISHPIQYQAPLLRMIAADPDIDLEVFFYSDFSLKGYHDPGFDRLIEWDTPLTEGYKHQFLDCWGSKQWKGIFRQPVAKNIIRILKTKPFDAVWVHGWYHLCSLQTIIAAHRLGIPVLLRGESNGIEKTSPLIKKLVKKIYLNWLSDHISKFLYVGTQNYNFYHQQGIKEQKLFHMPYAVDNNFFQAEIQKAKTTREDFRQFLGLEPGRPIILFAAKLVNRKRPQDLLAAYQRLSTDAVKEPEPYLLYVGDGNLRESLEIAAKATGWQSIRFLGFQNQSKLPALYDLCDVFVLPSEFEPWGLAINEVMNAGKALVVSDQVGCGPDLIVEKQNGYIFPVGDIPAFAIAIQWALNNKVSAGRNSLKQIQSWGFEQDICGLKAACNITT